VVVRDLENGGSPDFTFRLLAGRMPFIAGFLPRGERPGTTVGMQLDGPNIPAKSPATVTIPKTAHAGDFWAETRLATGHAALLPLIVDDVPAAWITETDANMPLPLPPIALDGAFERYTAIRFFWKAVPGEHYEFDLLGERIGSRIDGEIRILDQAGKTIASNDDAVGKDPRLEF